jgi:hypothetical protein
MPWQTYHQRTKAIEFEKKHGNVALFVLRLGEQIIETLHQ